WRRRMTLDKFRVESDHTSGRTKIDKFVSVFKYRVVIELKPDYTSYCVVYLHTACLYIVADKSMCSRYTDSFISTFGNSKILVAGKTFRSCDPGEIVIIFVQNSNTIFCGYPYCSC